MQFITPKGFKKSFNAQKYRINWDGKSPSKFQAEVKAFLKPHWFAQVVFEEMVIPGTRMRIDFYNANKKLAVEVDGAQHDKFNKHFHKNSRAVYAAHIFRDYDKEDWCELNSIKLIRIKPEDMPLTKQFFLKLGVNL